MDFTGHCGKVEVPTAAKIRVAKPKDQAELYRRLAVKRPESTRLGALLSGFASGVLMANQSSTRNETGF